jgi:hypothetical protein
MEWLAVAIPAAGLLGLMLGCTLGAWMGGVSLWKGSAVGIGGSVTQAVLSELVIKPLTMIDNILLDYAIFFVVAGGIAYFLHIGAKATALIVVGAFLGMMTFALVAFQLVLSQIGS